MDLELCIGMFVPNSTIHMIGPNVYRKLLCNNYAFLQNITTVPLGNFQHETLDIPFSNETNMDIDTMMLTKTILEQPWHLSFECIMTPNKILIVTKWGNYNQLVNGLTKHFQNYTINTLQTSMG